MAERIMMMETLPDEVLELILSKVSPYEDGENCACVCSRWCRIMSRVRVRRKGRFLSGILSGCLKVTQGLKENGSMTIAKRYSHSAVYHDKGLYVFGGCTSTSTTFNDLWRLDLTTRTWNRIFTTGHYPLPKASASFLSYQNELYLFGGWSFLSLYPNIPGSTKLLNELHVYSPYLNKWTRITMHKSNRSPPCSAGHSASIQGENMIVFGGLQKTASLGHFASSNDTWIFNIPEKTWSLLPSTHQRPSPRYGQSQIKLSEEHFLIIGGSDRGPNGVFHDVWLFDMSKEPWKWYRCEVANSQYGASDLWCHPACKIGDYVVMLSMSKSNARNSLHSEDERSPAIHRRMDLGAGVIQRHPRRREDLAEPVQDLPSNEAMKGPIIRPDPLGERMQAFATQVPRSNVITNRKSRETRQKQLDALKKLEDRLLKIKAQEEQNKMNSQYDYIPSEKFVLHVLDVSKAISNRVVTWLQVKTSFPYEPPEETLFYSLVSCRSELVMFGGVQMDASSVRSSIPYQTKESVSNNTYYFTPFQEII